MTLTSLLCHDQVPDLTLNNDEENRILNDTYNEQNGSSNSSSPSKTDQKMLDYFMEFSNSSDENRKKRKVKHRINNKKHRQRKQIELDQLRRNVPEYENELNELKLKYELRRTSTAKNSIWHHMAEIEKKKLNISIEERQLLQKTIQAHEILIQLYEKQLEKNGIKYIKMNSTEKK